MSNQATVSMLWASSMTFLKAVSVSTLQHPCMSVHLQGTCRRSICTPETLPNSKMDMKRHIFTDKKKKKTVEWKKWEEAAQFSSFSFKFCEKQMNTLHTIQERISGEMHVCLPEMFPDKRDSSFHKTNCSCHEWWCKKPPAQEHCCRNKPLPINTILYLSSILWRIIANLDKESYAV